MDSSYFTIFMQTRNLPICQSIIEYLKQTDDHRYVLHIQAYDFNKLDGNDEFKSIFEFLIIQTIIKYKQINSLNQVINQKQQTSSETNNRNIIFISNYKHQSVTPSKSLLNTTNISSHCTNDILRHMSLINCSVDDTKLNILSSVLYMFPQLLSLDLRHNLITYHSLPLLSESLIKSCRCVHTLRFDNNDINTKGAKSIANIIQSFGHTLKILSISNNPLHNLGASYILYACLNRYRRAARAVDSLITQMVTTSPVPILSPRQNHAQPAQCKSNDTQQLLTVPILRADGGHIYQDLDLLDKYYYDINKNYENNRDSNGDGSSNITSNKNYMNSSSNCIYIPDENGIYNDAYDNEISNSIKDSHKYKQYLQQTTTNNTYIPHAKFRYCYHRLKYKLFAVTVFRQLNSYISASQQHTLYNNSNTFNNSSETNPQTRLNHSYGYAPLLTSLNLSNCCVLSIDDNRSSGITHLNANNSYNNIVRASRNMDNNNHNHVPSLFLQILQLVLCDSKYLVDIDLSHNRLSDEGAVILSSCILTRSMINKEARKMNSSSGGNSGEGSYGNSHSDSILFNGAGEDNCRSQLSPCISIPMAMAPSPLRTLRLPHCGITDVGIQCLCETITLTRTLHTLDLSSSPSALSNIEITTNSINNIGNSRNNSDNTTNTTTSSTTASTSTPNVFTQTGIGWISSATSAYALDDTTLVFTPSQPLPSQPLLTSHTSGDTTANNTPIVPEGVLTEYKNLCHEYLQVLHTPQ